MEGVELINNRAPLICDSCEHTKLTCKAIQKERQAPMANAFGAEVHTNLWGPSPTMSLGKCHYYITFTDDHTRYTRVEILTTKDKALDKYKDFAAWAHTQHGVKVKRLRSDRSGEYTSGAFNQFLWEQGTEHRLTTHDTPQHNGIAESLNRCLVECVRAILHQSGLPATLWAEALHFIVWVKNRTLTRVLGNVTPHEKLTGQKPNIAGVPKWGQRVWVHTTMNSKLGACGVIAHWVGYDRDSTHAHRIYWPGKNKVSVERNVKFTAGTEVISITSSSSSSPSTPSTPALTSLHPAPTTSTAPASSTPIQATRAPPQPPAATDSGEEEIEVEDELANTPPPLASQGKKSKANQPAQPMHRLSCIRRPSQKVASGAGTTDASMQGPPGHHPDFDKDSNTLTEMIADMDALSEECKDDEGAYLVEIKEAIAAAVQDAEGDLKSYWEAQSRSDWPCWKDAMDREIESLQQAGTWEKVPCPPDKNIVSCKWVYRLKRKADGTTDKYKARLVARGFSQIYSVDYLDTYSPVAKLASFRTILALAARFDWEVECFDFNSAYLNGELEELEEIYMEQPPGYEEGGKDFVKRLRKALYGLKQAGHRWYDTFKCKLADLGFRASAADPGVFYARIDSNILVIAAHVDDCAMTGHSGKLITVYKAKLNDKFPLTDLRSINSLLGIQVTCDRAACTISLSQKSYINAILARFRMADAKSYPTPMVPAASYSICDSPSSPTDLARMRKVPYRKAIGSLMYAAVATHPDIAFAVSTLSQFLENPGEAHWQAVKHVFRYLARTCDHALTYGAERHELLGYTDADGASQEHRHAISGYAFLIDGGAVSWMSHKQELVTLSTAEAEYVAATHAAKECIWLRHLTHELFPSLTSQTTLHCDNRAALALAVDDNYHAWTKHIDICYHFIHECIVWKVIDLVYCPTDNMTADILTKALPQWKVACHSLGLCYARTLRIVNTRLE